MKTKMSKVKGFAAVLTVCLLVGAGVPSLALAGKPGGGTSPTGPSATVTTARTASSVLITDAFKNVGRGTHTEQTKVYSPDGGLYQTFSSTFSPVKGAYTVTHEMLVAGTWAETLPGTWRVRVYLDGAEVGTTTFQLP